MEYYCYKFLIQDAIDMSITKQEAETLLYPYKEKILNVFKLAWDDWLKRLKENPTCSKRGRSNFVWDQIVFHANQEFKHIPNHQFSILSHSNNQTCNFIINQKLVFRAKKGNMSRRSSNIPTTMALNFHDPEQSLPGIGNLPRIEIQYELDKTESSIIDIIAVARDKSLIVWTSSLKYNDSDELPINATIPINPLPSEHNSVKKRVKLKSDKKQEFKRVVGE